jgi:hypothetical protein
MKKFRSNVVALIVAITAFYGCSDTIEPVSSFRLQGDTISVLKVGTFDEFLAASESESSNSVLWELGDGRTSTETSLSISYPKSGTYTLKLTASNEDGETSVSSKKIVVLDRVLKRIDLYFAQWDSTNYTEPWPRTNMVDIYFQMQNYSDESYDKDGFYYNCPVIYTSSVMPNVKNKGYWTKQPSVIIPVNERIVINKNMVQFAPGNLNNAYLFSIMGKDASGNKYRITNNAFYGFSFGIMEDNVKENRFIISQGGYTCYDLVCDFE